MWEHFWRKKNELSRTNHLEIAAIILVPPFPNRLRASTTSWFLPSTLEGNNNLIFVFKKILMDLSWGASLNAHVSFPEKSHSGRFGNAPTSDGNLSVMMIIYRFRLVSSRLYSNQQNHPRMLGTANAEVVLFEVIPIQVTLRWGFQRWHHR